MSLSMILLEMLHCNQMSTKSTNDARNKNLQEKISTKKKSNSGCVCRICLKEGSIKIFGNKIAENIAEDLTESIKVFAGIEISKDDPYPKYLCRSCHRLLQGAILFRKTAQQSYEILKKRSEDLPTVVSDGSSKEFDDHRQPEECEEKKVVCPDCNKSYTDLEFKKHLALHRVKKPSYMCDICGKNFNFLGHFTQHRQTHFYKLPIKCSLCSYRGRSNQALKLHMRSHTGERPYQCEKCPSRFVTKSNLNRHTQTHKAERDFKCETCGRGFYTRSNLELHFKVDHTGIKEHVCNICGKAFGYRKQMMKHQLHVHKRAKLKSGKMPLYLQVENMKQQGLNVDT